MSEEKLEKIVVSKREFKEAFLHLYNDLKVYAKIIDDCTINGKIDPKKIANSIPSQLKYLEFDSINVRAMEMIGAYMKSTLEYINGDTISFMIPEEPEDNFFKTNKDWEVLSKTLGEVEFDLREIQEKVYYLTKSLPITSKEKVRKVLKVVAMLFKSIVRKDSESVSSHVNHLHYITANKDSYFLIHDIGKVTRDIYNSIQDFGEGINLDELEPQVTDSMPDAITKLNAVIQRTENAANATLDDVEKLLEKNTEEQVLVENTLEKITQMEKEIEALGKEYPKMNDVFSQLLQDVKHDLHSTMESRTETLKAEEAIYLKIISNQSFQDLTGQTLRKIIKLIEDMEIHLLNILQKYGGDTMRKETNEKRTTDVRDGISLEGPQDPSNMTSQGDVDNLLSELGF